MLLTKNLEIFLQNVDLTLQKKLWQIFIKKIVDSEFKIGETIWWIRYKSTYSLQNSGVHDS